MCCGAAGTYNLTQPEMARELGERKIGHIAATGCKVCVTGNVGCALQIKAHAVAEQRELRVVHPVELLHRSVFGSARAGAGETRESKNVANRKGLGAFDRGILPIGKLFYRCRAV